MSQHQFPATVEGRNLQVTVGYDPTLSEMFAMTEGDNDEPEFNSSPSPNLQTVAAELLGKTGVAIPEPVMAAIRKDSVDFRMGASDLGRRIYQYDAQGVQTSSMTY